MHKETLATKWRELQGKVKGRWGKLTDDELMKIAGDYHLLVAKIQEKYGLAREEVERQLDALLMEGPTEPVKTPEVPGRTTR